MYKLIITDQAGDDLESLRRYHESKSEGAGIEFLISLDETLERIEENPAIFQYLLTEKEGVRRGIERKFLSIILYQVYGNVVEIQRIKDSRSDWK